MKIEEKIENGITIRNIIYEETDFPTEQEKLNWLSICNSCEYKSNDTCNYCGCIIMTLMAYKTSKCPNNKW